MRENECAHGVKNRRPDFALLAIYSHHRASGVGYIDKVSHGEWRAWGRCQNAGGKSVNRKTNAKAKCILHHAVIRCTASRMGLR